MLKLSQKFSFSTLRRSIKIKVAFGSSLFFIGGHYERQRSRRPIILIWREVGSVHKKYKLLQSIATKCNFTDYGYDEINDNLIIFDRNSFLKIFTRPLGRKGYFKISQRFFVGFVYHRLTVAAGQFICEADKLGHEIQYELWKHDNSQTKCHYSRTKYEGILRYDSSVVLSPVATDPIKRLISTVTREKYGNSHQKSQIK